MPMNGLLCAENFGVPCFQAIQLNLNVIDRDSSGSLEASVFFVYTPI